MKKKYQTIDEVDYLRNENEKLKNDLKKLENKKNNKELETDIISLVDISKRMQKLLIICRSQTLPIELGKQIDNILKEIENR